MHKIHFCAQDTTFLFGIVIVSRSIHRQYMQLGQFRNYFKANALTMERPIPKYQSALSKDRSKFKMGQIILKLRKAVYRYSENAGVVLVNFLLIHANELIY